MNGMLFVHAGFEPGFSMELQQRDVLLWDRELAFLADRYCQNTTKISGYKKIFVGHTPTTENSVEIEQGMSGKLYTHQMSA
jgi:hypothetical protein